MIRKTSDDRLESVGLTGDFEDHLAIGSVLDRWYNEQIRVCEEFAKTARVLLTGFP